MSVECQTNSRTSTMTLARPSRLKTSPLTNSAALRSLSTSSALSKAKKHSQPPLMLPKPCIRTCGTVYKTAILADIVRLVNHCFSINHLQWRTGEDHPVPALKEITPSVKNVAVPFAVFIVPIDAVSKVKGYNIPGRKEIMSLLICFTPVKVCWVAQV